MGPKIYQLTLSTRYGPATYLLRIDEDAEVEIRGLPFAGLPESVPRLTYGKQWEAALSYFRGLATTLPHRIGEALRMAEAPKELRELTSRVQMDFAGASWLDANFWKEYAEYSGAYALDEATLNGALFRLGRPEAYRASPELAQRLLPYLLTLLPVSSDATTRLVYAVLGAMRTEGARNALLHGLELEGRHPYTTELLRNLSSYIAPDTRRRLESVYHAGRIAEDDLADYLQLLSQFNDPGLSGHLTEVVKDHPSEVANVVQAMRSNGLKRREIAEILHERFYAEADYYALDPLLRALSGVQIAQYAIDLAGMNARVALPAYTDVPPVNWPQQLEPAWAHLVKSTPHPEALRVIGAYLSRPEPRLQRNALLQLKVLLRDAPPLNPLPVQIEDRLRELLPSRYDKVSVEVLNVLGRRDLRIRDREAMLDAVLAVSIGSRYRFVVLNALNRIGDTAAMKQRAHRYLGGEIRAAADPDRLEQIGALLPFVEKYLGNIDPLRRELSGQYDQISKQ